MSEISPEQWKRIEALFAEAAELAAPERVAFLDRTCGDDATVRTEVESLLAVRPRAERFMGRPAVEGDVARDLRESLRESRPRGLVGKTVGRYTIRRVLASGGMGTVYEAGQDSPRRAVALKVISPGVATAGLIRRFEQEAEVLGRLQHPGIAQIYDAGTFDLGAGSQPYFAMELIRGVPLTDYAERNGLGTRQRVELMMKVCAAVHHAHQRGVIHRDLKPANVLVDDTAGTAGGGQPKILDFGVARATDADLQTATLRTDIGQLIGTVPYMSPEQATGRPDEVDIRSDVYALGVVLYELLAGRLPYEVHDKMIHEAVRVIREDDPTPLSTINPAFRGDLETILIKALEKDKDRRYQSASELQADLARYLNDEPIAARPPSVLYQLGKLAKRHKALVGSMAAVLVVLVAGVAVTTVMAIEQTRLHKAAEDRRHEAVAERDRAVEAEKIAEQRRVEAERQTRIAQAVNDFLNVDLLEAVDPSRTPDPNITMREVLDLAAKRIEGKFADEPLVEAAIRATIAGTYRNLGENESALPQIQTALTLRESELGHDDPATLSARSLLALVLWGEGEYAEAERMQLELLDERRRTLGPRNRDTLTTMNNLALVYWAEGRIGDAVDLLQQALEVKRSMAATNDEGTLMIMFNLGNYFVDLSRFDEAEAMLTETLDRRRATLGDDNPSTISTMSALARLYNNTSRFEQARSLAEEALARSRQVLGEQSGAALTAMAALADAYRNLQQYDEAERTLVERVRLARAAMASHDRSPARAVSDLGQYYHEQGRDAEALPLLEEARELYRESLGENHIYTLIVTELLGELYMSMGRTDDAEPLFDTVLRVRREQLGEDDPQTLTAMTNVGWVLWRRGQLAEAEPYFRQALEGRRRVLPPRHPHTLRVLGQLGNLLQMEKKYDEAEPLVVEAYQAQEEVLGKSHPDTLVALSILSLFYAEQGRFDEAEPRARTALERAQATLPTGHWFIGVFMVRHGECLAGMERYDEAEPELLEGERILNTALGPNHPRTLQAIQTLAAFYDLRKDPDNASAWRAKLAPPAEGGGN